MDERRPKEQTDEQLMEAYQQGVPQAFEELFHRYSPRLYGFLRKRSSNTQTIEDVFQRTFQKLHANRSRYDITLPFSAWIFTICRNALFDELRKQQRTQEAPAENYERLLSKIPTHKTGTIEKPDLLEDLSSAQKEAIELRYYEDLPFEEIALRLGTSPANARQLVSRGIRKLKSLMGSS